uniref:hypothetical protein n=1 Tax=Alloprevotella sp. TaxID=1872471 RepID=UPI0040280DA7
QVEALPARLLGGLFVSLYWVNAALFRIGPTRRLFRRANAALFRRAVPLFILLSQVAAVCTFGMSIF